MKHAILMAVAVAALIVIGSIVLSAVEKSEDERFNACVDRGGHYVQLRGDDICIDPSALR